MKIKTLEKLFEQEKVHQLEWIGKCHDCKAEVSIIITKHDKDMTIEGGAIYEGDKSNPEEYFFKCDECFKIKPTLTDFQPVECYSRVVGYLRPVDQWNAAKEQEFELRENYQIS